MLDLIEKTIPELTVQEKASKLRKAINSIPQMSIGEVLKAMSNAQEYVFRDMKTYERLRKIQFTKGIEI